MNKIFILFVFFIASNCCFPQDFKDISFSHSSGFFETPFYLKIQSAQGNIFFFKENNINNQRKLFPDSLLIDNTTTLSLLYEKNDSTVKLGSYSYFIGFKTNFKVVSISIDDEFLFNHNKGIYKKGPRAYFDTVKNHYRNVNWERSWEKENYVEIFNENGDRVIGQPSGIRIFGGMTKYYPEKSLRLIARSIYGDNRFNADIFNKGKRKYKQFILRHSGNDYRKLRFKDALITSLAAESNLDVQASSPAHIFVNSEYWGVYNIREKVNKFYIDNNHNSGISSVDILQGYRTVDSGTRDAYDKLLNFINRNDLSLSKNYKEVQKMMSTRNFSNFWIHQIHSANHDVRGNIRFWRSDSLDGRFRWIVYDTDLGFGASRYDHNILRDFTSKKMTDWYNPRWATFLLRNLLKNKSFKKDFILQSAYLLSSTLSTQNIKDRINVFKILYENEMKTHFSKRKKFQRYQGNLKNWNKSIGDLLAFADKRDSLSFIHLEDKFDLQEPYYLKLQINNYNKGKVFLNGNRIKKDIFNANFYSEFSLPITMIPNVGYTSKGYSLDTITAKSGDSLVISISFIRNELSDNKVIINEIDYLNDCFEIFNPGDETISLDGWKIVDKNYNIYTIEGVSLKNNRFLVFYNKTIENKIDSVDYIKIGFNISSSTELLKLYDNQERLVDSVSYNLIEVDSSYSRHMPFDTDKASINWQNNSDFTIGYHNKSYTSLIYKRHQEELQIKKKRKMLFIFVGVLVLIPLFLIVGKK